MSSTSSSVRLPAVSQLWPRARRLLALAFVAGVGFAVATSTAAPHLLAVAGVNVQRWMAGLSAVDVFVGLVVLFGLAIGVAVTTAIDYENNHELFDVR